MHPFLNTAFTAARHAGRMMVKKLDRLDQVKISQKEQNDLVSEVDVAAESIIVEAIRDAYPEHRILSEECGEISGSDEFRWIIDPLDGTKNYLHGLPQFAISIGIEYKGEVQHGLVYDPLHDELFHASRGAGAYLNDKRIRVSSRYNLKDGLIGTGFPFRHHGILPTYLDVFSKVLNQCSDIRRAGAAALDLCFVACGRLDGFWECKLNIWDIAAGALIVKEAGGFVTDIFGKEEYLASGYLIAGNKKTHPALLKIIAPYAKKFIEQS